MQLHEVLQLKLPLSLPQSLNTVQGKGLAKHPLEIADVKGHVSYKAHFCARLHERARYTIFSTKVPSLIIVAISP
jgi:hypothetical protein